MTARHRPILIFGGAGQLGATLHRYCGVAATSLTRLECDVTDRDQVEQAIGALRPSIVINTAAMTDVDACETEPQRAGIINAWAPGFIADVCRRNDAHFVQISTDFVFGGGAARHAEWSPTGPVNVYGQTKLAGEHAALAANPSALIVRTAWLFSNLDTGFLRWVASAAEKPELEVLGDSIGSPSFAEDVATATIWLAKRRVSGIVHVVSGGDPGTRAEMADLALVSLGSQCKVVPVTETEIRRPATRPENSALDTSLLQHLGYPNMPTWRERLEHLGKQSR